MRGLALCGLVGCTQAVGVVCETPTGLSTFPGAEGYGTDTPGGRGGAVLIVTSLEDLGPGSLREAVATEGPRTVVFQVAGEIRLDGHLEVVEPFLTVAGQSAPGDGVVITGAGVAIYTHDVVLQHLRIRPGTGNVVPEHNDVVQVLGEQHVDVGGAHHVVLDHLSASWGEDENISVWGAHHVTVSHSIVSEALDEAGHAKGGHSAGVLVGSDATCVTGHHNVLAHNGFRNPLFGGAGRVDWIANLAYNWGELAAEVQPRRLPAEVNLVGNVWLEGPDSQVLSGQVHVLDDPQVHWFGGNSWALMAARSALYFDDNLGPARTGGAQDRIATAGYGATPVPDEQLVANAFPGPPVTRSTASSLAEDLLQDVGAVRPVRDGVDGRIIEEVRSGTGRIIDRQTDVPWPELAEAPPPEDADRDGLPDAWERQRGLDPTDPTDALLDDDGDGYTNLEAWLHGL